MSARHKFESAADFKEHRDALVARYKRAVATACVNAFGTVKSVNVGDGFTVSPQEALGPAIEAAHAATADLLKEIAALANADIGEG